MAFKNKYIEKLAKEHRKACVSELSIAGEGLIQDAYYEAEFSNRTYNLRDSYGYGVYFNGALEAKGFIGSAKASEPNKGVSGRPEIESYLNGYQANRSGWELIILAAVWYAQDLEEGFTPSGRIYKVISSVGDKVYNLRDKVKGTVRLILDGQKQ